MSSKKKEFEHHDLSFIHNYWTLEKAYEKMEYHKKDFYLFASDKFNKRDGNIVKHYHIIEKDKFFDYIMSISEENRSFYDIINKR